LGRVAAMETAMSGKYDGESFPSVVEAAKAAGGSVGYAHPYRYPPARTLGSYDEESGNEKAVVTHIEVWNGPDIEMNPDYKSAMRMYLQILRRRPVAAVSGSDFHAPSVLGHYFSLTYLGMEGKPDPDKALNAILKRNTYIAYGWKLDDADPLLRALGATLKPGKLECELTIDRLSPPLVGVYDSVVIPHEAEIISCEKEGYFVIGAGKFEIDDDRMTAHAYLSADLRPGTRLVLQVHGAADGMRTALLVTSPIEVNE